MNGSREKILNRVRDAMRTPAPQPVAPSGAPMFAPFTNPEQRFHEEFRTLKGEIIDSQEKLRGFLASFTKIATDGSKLVKQAVGAGNAGVREADLGVTACDCLIAQMGAIVVSPKSAGGRALSVLPPVHLVIAQRDQLLPDLATALVFIRRRYDGQWPSTLSIITGPSRTGDIEKVLVLGAHGPKRLAVFFVD
jgi:L-lactate dehydrogenase complex protein LldG